MSSWSVGNSESTPYFNRAEIMTKLEKERDYEQLLSRKELAEMLKVHLVTVSKCQKEGSFYLPG